MPPNPGLALGAEKGQSTLGSLKTAQAASFSAGLAIAARTATKRSLADKFPAIRVFDLKPPCDGAYGGHNPSLPMLVRLLVMADTTSKRANS